MKTFRLYISIFTLLSFVSCTNSDKTLDYSSVFYSDFKSDFLKSDLTKYSYNPRFQFVLNGHNIDAYRVVIFRDSSLRIEGVQAFSKAFNVRIDTFFNSDVILSKLSDCNYILRSPFNDESLTHIIPKQTTSINIVEYFFNLKRLLNKYKIIEIKLHSSVNIKTIVFSDHDYLIYKPDSLVFNDSENIEFMKFLFENSKQLDKNWYQFHKHINTDYQ